MRSANQRIKHPLAALVAVLGAFSLAVAGFTVPAWAADTLLPGPAPIEQRSSTTMTSDRLPTVQIDAGVVWAQEIVGNIVYAGGSFSNARPADATPGTNLMPRSNILAYDIRTGVITAFAPSINGTVKSVKASPDGKRLYVGGSFNSVDGQTRWNFAAFDTATGALVSTFAPSVGGSYVNAIAVTDSAVYVGGNIGAGNGVARKGFAAFNLSGALLGWAPTADLQVDAMTLTPQKDKLIAAGRFAVVNGVVQRGMAALDLSTGALLPWQAPTIILNGKGSGTGAGKAGIWGLTTDQNAVYGTGWVFADKTVGNLEGTFAAEPGTGEIRWIADCHGDHYGVYSDGKTVYTTSHEHACESAGGMTQKQPENLRNASATTAVAKGTLSRSPWVNSIYKDWSGYPAPAFVNWYPDWLTGKATGMGQAGFSIVGTGNYISVGGEFVGVNNQHQQGLARFSSNPPGGPKQGPRLSGTGWTPSATSVAAGSARVTIGANWDRDDLNLTYSLMRVGQSQPVASTTVQSTYWNLPAVTLKDTGLSPGTTHTYYVVAKDADGNAATSAQTTVKISDSSASPYAEAVLNANPALYWPLGGSASVAAADSVGSNDGTVGTGVGSTSTGGGSIAGDTSPASTFNGTTNGVIGSSQRAAAGTGFSTELWFKTATTQGGKLMGYGSSPSGASTSYDRHVYMLDDGRLTFGAYTGSTKVVTSSSSYNNNAWHHVVATQGPAGMVLYVDGNVVGTDLQTTTAQDYNGYWRVGGDNLSGWPNRPSSDYFNGSLDNFAVYNTVLPKTQVAAHYALGTGQGVPTASFTATPEALDVAFDAKNSTAPAGQSIQSYQWNFGDGSPTATGVTVNHSYTAAGSYTVLLTVTSSAGVPGTSSKTVAVTAPVVNKAPVAGFAASVSGLKVSVDGAGSSDADGSVASYAWEFGDGAVGASVTAEHVYAAAGSYTVKLVVTDDQGLASVAATRSVTVTAPASDVVAQDAFGRTLSNGWGSADVGGPWSLTGGVSMFEVDGGSAKMVLPPGSTRVAHLKGVSSVDSDSRVTVSLDSVPTGSGDFTTVVGRQVGSSSYLLKSWVKADGAVALVLFRDSTVLQLLTVPGLKYSSNMVLNLRLQVAGTSPTTVQGKIWKVGESEPATWQASVTDSTSGLQQAGSVGLGAYLSGAATAVVATSFDNYKVTTSDAPAAKKAPAKEAPLKDAPAVDEAPADDVPAKDAPVVDEAPAEDVPAKDAPVVDEAPAEDVPAKDAPVVDEAPANEAPVAGFAASVSGLKVSVDGAGSSDADGSVASYAWEFGDGAVGASVTAEHVYAAAGSYTVKLVVTDDQGLASVAATRSVTVIAPEPTLAKEMVPKPDHVVVVVMENRSSANILGNADAPFINSLASSGASMTESDAVAQPSQPNYLALFSGSTQGIADDSCPHNFTTPNVASQLVGAGMTFTGYADGLPSAGFLGCESGDYARRHTPWVNWPAIPAAASQPMTAFPTDYSLLPTVSFVIPNVQHDMHDGTIAQSDAWLQENLGGYADWAKQNNSLLILTWDESDSKSRNHIPTIITGQEVVPGEYSEKITHYSVLRTIQEAFGLPANDGTTTALPITDIWTK